MWVAVARPRNVIAAVGCAAILMAPQGSEAQGGGGAGRSAPQAVEDDPDFDLSVTQPDFTVITLPTTLRVPRFKPGFPFWPSRSAPLYSKRPSAWAGCVRGPCFRLPTPSAGVTWRSHAPESTWFWGMSRTPLPACARSSRVLRRDARCTSARRHGQRPDPLQHRPEQAPRQMTLSQQRNATFRKPLNVN